MIIRQIDNSLEIDAVVATYEEAPDAAGAKARVRERFTASLYELPAVEETSRRRLRLMATTGIAAAASIALVCGGLWLARDRGIDVQPADTPSPSQVTPPSPAPSVPANTDATGTPGPEGSGTATTSMPRITLPGNLPAPAAANVVTLTDKHFPGGEPTPGYMALQAGGTTFLDFAEFGVPDSAHRVWVRIRTTERNGVTNLVVVDQESREPIPPMQGDGADEYVTYALISPDIQGGMRIESSKDTTFQVDILGYEERGEQNVFDLRTLHGQSVSLEISYKNTGEPNVMNCWLGSAGSLECKTPQDYDLEILPTACAMLKGTHLVLNAGGKASIQCPPETPRKLSVAHFEWNGVGTLYGPHGLVCHSDGKAFTCGYTASVEAFRIGDDGVTFTETTGETTTFDETP